MRQRLLDARAPRVRPARDDKVVAAWNGLAISGLVDAGCASTRPTYVEAAVRCGGTFLVASHLGQTAGCLRGSPATASPARTPACWRTTAASRRRSSRWRPRPATGSGSSAPAQLLDVALAHFAADDGGFHDTADDAEALVARPRDPSDNASPSGHSAVVHALLAYAALTGSGPHRDAAGARR